MHDVGDARLSKFVAVSLEITDAAIVQLFLYVVELLLPVINLTLIENFPVVAS